MGIPRGTARLLLDEARRQPFSGSVIELGKMLVFFTRRELEGWARAQRVPLADLEVVELSHDPALAAEGGLGDRDFFRLLGFDEVVSCDVSPWEGADLVVDLNRPVPEELHGRFDAVFEGGTIQHVFHLPQVLENVFRLLKPGGRVIHGMSPSNNHVDHGFHMFSPTVFQDFYAANGFEINAFYVFDFVPFWVRGRLDTSRWRIYRYTPGCLDHLSYGRMGGRQLGLFVVATRTPQATGDVAPQQGFYRSFWTERAAEPAEPPAAVPATPRAVRRLDPILGAWKLLRERVVRWAPKKMPPVVARY